MRALGMQHRKHAVWCWAQSWSQLSSHTADSVNYNSSMSGAAAAIFTVVDND